MFTGLIEGRGEIQRISRRGAEFELELSLDFPAPDIAVGESISVNGVCLTVERPRTGGFSAYASAETAACSTLGELKSGAGVNIERALRLGARLGGHLVSGHVDGVAEVLETVDRGASREVWLSFPRELAPQIAAKGSVALDGVSLTVNTCLADRFSVNVIPETVRVTTAAGWRPGCKVNLETDLLAKYVTRYLSFAGGVAMSGILDSAEEKAPKNELTLDFLHEHGF